MNFYLKTINLQGLVINNLLLSKANSQNCELSALNPLHGCSLADRLFHDLLARFTCFLLAFEVHLHFLLDFKFAAMVAQFFPSLLVLFADLSCFSGSSGKVRILRIFVRTCRPGTVYTGNQTI